MRQQSSAGFAAVTVPIYLVLLWFSASVLRTAGVYVFLVGTIALVVGWLFLLRGQRGILYAAYLAVLLMAGLVGACEMTLCFAPNLLRGMVANYAYGRYHTNVGGIYDYDEHMSKRLKPNLVCSNYFNGHRWTHDSNARGYRGPQLESADTVFLGDSLIYGHGVETHQTVPHEFEVESGLRSANLGIQGSGFMQAWMRFKRLGVPLRPKWVFLCSCYNDIIDVNHDYSAEELNTFVASAVDDDTEPLARSEFHPPVWWELQRNWSDRLALPLYSAGAVRVLGQGFKLGLQNLAKPVAAVPDQNFADRPWELTTDDTKLAWRAHCHALRKIQHLCREQGATLVVFDVGFPRQFTQATETAVKESGIAYSIAGRTVFERSLAGEAMYLVDDGHWSAKGCQTVAHELAQEFIHTSEVAQRLK